MKTNLKKAAEVYNAAPRNLLAAIVEASKDGATNVEIAMEIDYTYSPDYIGKLISKTVGPRVGGRRPGRRRRAEVAREIDHAATPSSAESPDSPKGD